MMLPNFLIIGAQKAGTTSLSLYLKQHPQIYIDGDEPHFFAFEGKRPKLLGPRAAETLFWKTRITTLESYQKLFQHVTTEKAVGETSSYYLFIPETPKRIFHYIPHVKLIAILRNPVDRAYSNFWHCVRLGFEPCTDFVRALQEEEHSRKHWGIVWQYKAKGCYYTQLKRYYEVFDHTQIRVYLNEDLAKAPEDMLKDIFGFLGVNDRFLPDVSSKHNINPGIPRNMMLYKFLHKQHPLYGISKYFLPGNIRNQIISVLRNNNLKKATLSLKLRKQLIKYYREDILQLQDLIQRDLTNWLELM